MSDTITIKTTPLSVDGYSMVIQKEIYSFNDSWSISACLKHIDYPYSIISETLSCSWPDQFKRPTEDEAQIKLEEYLQKLGSLEEAVDKMVQWWADKSFNVGLNQNNGDSSAAGAFGFALANMISLDAQKEITHAQIDTFKGELKRQIMEAPYNHVSVDYDGDKCLTDACKKAGISVMCLPIKTHSSIHRFSHVASASFGYHGATEYL